MSRLILPRRDLIVPARHRQGGFLLNPYRFGAAGGGDKRYWRIYVTANNGGAGIVIQEVEFRLTPSGADVTTPSTPVTVSNAFSGYPGSKMVDNSVVNDQDVWYSDSSSPWWAYFDLGADTAVAEVAIMPQNNGGTGPGRAPKDFLIQSSPNAAAWTTEKTVTGSTGWTAGAFRTFSIP